jgi:RNA polymerase sigma-B factor
VSASPAVPAAVPFADRDRHRVDRELFRRLAETGHPADRELLVERFLPLARSLAARFVSRGDASEDVFQVACVGLVKAIDRFDPERGGAFSSFAVPTITGEIKRCYRDRTWTVHVPRDLQDLALKVLRAAEVLEGQLQRKPTVLEIAEHLGVGDEGVLDALQASHAKSARSLDAPPREQSDETPTTLGATLGIEEGGFEHVERCETLRRLMVVLSPRERLVLQLRYQEDMTQHEIGERIGVSQMQISRILRQAMAKLHDHACRHNGPAVAAAEPALSAC